MTELFLAINWQGKLIELYHSDLGAQKFYETICRAHVKDRQCQFIDARFVRRSRCVQQYSYAYAVARTMDTNDKPTDRYHIDLIRVASGCKCHLDPGV